MPLLILRRILIMGKKAAAVADTEKKEPTMDDIIAELTNDINASLGPGHAYSGENCEHVRYVLPTGCMRLDLAMECGGLPIPDGVFTEIYGPEGSGKSTIALMCIAQYLKKYPNDLAVYVDLEHTLKTKEDLLYAQRLGVDMKRLIPVQVSTGEDAITTLEKALIRPQVRLAVVDSVKNMYTITQMEREPDDKPLMAPLARFCSQNIPKILRLINLNQYNRKSVIFLNQIYLDLNSYGTPEKPPGGNTIPHLSHVIIHLQKSKSKDNTVYTNKTGERSWTKEPPVGAGKMGYSVNGTVMKSRVSGAGACANTFKFKLLKDHGVDKLYDILSSGMVTGVFVKEGTSTYKHLRQNGDGTMHVIQNSNGINNFMQYIESLNYNDIYNEIMSVGRAIYSYE